MSHLDSYSSSAWGNPLPSPRNRPQTKLLRRRYARKPESSNMGAPIPTRYDMLRGAYGPFRANNDLLYYHLDIRVDPDKKFISGKNTIRFSMLKDGTRIQIDLTEKLNIDKILWRRRRRSSTSATPARSLSISADAARGPSLFHRFLLLRPSAGDGPLRRIHLQERCRRARLDQHRLRGHRRQHLVAR